MEWASGQPAYRLLKLIALLAVCLAIGGALIHHFILVPDQLYRQLKLDIQSLANRRPAHVPPGEWEFAVGWTLNLHANCGLLYGKDTAEMQNFSNEFSRRLEGPVGLHTIDWIWDEYERLTKRGKSYSEKYRPTTSVDLHQAEPGCFGLWVR